MSRERRGAQGTPRLSMFYAGLAALALIEAAALYLFYLDHGHFWFEDVPAWGSVYGLVACVLIITVSKFLGKFWLMRPETYYEPRAARGDGAPQASGVERGGGAPATKQ